MNWLNGFCSRKFIGSSKKISSAIRIKNKRDFYRALTDLEMLDTILKQGLRYALSDKETFDDAEFEKLQKHNMDKIVDYFMNINDKLKLKELRIVSNP